MSPHVPSSDSIRTVALVGGTHGDELTGVALVRAFQQHPERMQRPGLDVTALIANEAAIAACRRGVDGDLNRSFAAAELADASLHSVEQRRAKAINAQLGPKGPDTATDLILDFHSAASDMGLNCNITGEDPFLFRLAALAIHRLAAEPDPLAVRCYQFPAPTGDAPYLPTIARHGMGVEVGPVMPGSLNAAIYFPTLRLAHTLLDLVAEYAAGRWPDAPLPLDVYTEIDTIPFPRDADGRLTAMVHPERTRLVYQPLQQGDPLFLDFHGRTIPYTGAPGLYPTFVNEPSYLAKDIALCLARHSQRMV